MWLFYEAGADVSKSKSRLLGNTPLSLFVRFDEVEKVSDAVVALPKRSARSRPPK